MRVHVSLLPTPYEYYDPMYASYMAMLLVDVTYRPQPLLEPRFKELDELDRENESLQDQTLLTHSNVHVSSSAEGADAGSDDDDDDNATAAIE